MTEILEAQFPQQLDIVRAIFSEYAESLGIDLGFQDFSGELAALPGKYAAPQGAVLLAWNNGEVIGSAALRPLDGSICEMKRLYVRPSGRGQQLGKKLATRIVQIAKQAGYTKIRLDTLPHMHAAQQLYASLGFRAIEAYVFNPVADAQFLELDLTLASGCGNGK
jgi:ribosomal protein S18 acetylase RimI-like enzyme